MNTKYYFSGQYDLFSSHQDLLKRKHGMGSLEFPEFGNSINGRDVVIVAGNERIIYLDVECPHIDICDFSCPLPKDSPPRKRLPSEYPSGAPPSKRPRL
jgi:hypothetical protein